MKFSELPENAKYFAREAYKRLFLLWGAMWMWSSMKEQARELLLHLSEWSTMIALQMFVLIKFYPNRAMCDQLIP